MVWAALSWASVVTWAYAKTRDTYVAYRKAGYSKKFREEHDEEILLHQAAKNAFDDTELVYVTVVIPNGAMGQNLVSIFLGTV